MPTIKLTVSVPHIQRDYDVELPDATTGQRLYDALIRRLDQNGGAVQNDVYELFSKRQGIKIYPDRSTESLRQMGIPNNDTVILKKDMDPGANL